MPHIQIPSIAKTSPSLAESMRMCRLRAGLSRASSAVPYALGTPKAWLGTAYHEVLEAIAAAEPTAESIEPIVDRVWTKSVQQQYERNLVHPLNFRFGRPATWPGYHLARAMALVRASGLRATGHPSRVGAVGVHAPALREHQFSALGGKLVGRPDVVRGEEVIDYKSGPVLELDSAQEYVVKSSYLRQLQSYAFLVHEVLGWWPKRGVLLPMTGEAVKVTLSPPECENAARDAVGLLDAYNASVGAGVEASLLASPTATACQWCPFKSICDAFWGTVNPEWSGQLDGACIEGQLLAVPRVLHAGAATALEIALDSGTEHPRQATITPLSTAMHPGAASMASGDRIRMVGLRVRTDGVFVPTPRTILSRVDDLPSLVTAASPR